MFSPARSISVMLPTPEGTVRVEETVLKSGMVLGTLVLVNDSVQLGGVVGVAIGVLVRVGVLVGVDVLVRVLVGVAVDVLVGVVVRVLVGVLVGCGEPQVPAMRNPQAM